MSIAGHVSRAMRRALDEIAAPQWAADVRRREEAERTDPQAVEVPGSPSRLQ